MFPITCNAIGDIFAVVQLIRDIVVALDDARGAAEEYKQFTRVLSALGTVMGEVYDLATASCNEALKQAVLEEVQLCCIDINNAHNSIAKFDRLEGDTSVRTSRAGTLFAKLHWHFLKASDAAKYAKRFSECHQRLGIYIGLLSHQSLSLLLKEQRYHLSVVPTQSRAARGPADRIEAVALSAFQQIPSISRQQVAEQTLSRPFFARPHDRRVASRVKRVADMIFDVLSPDTPRDQHDRFSSLLAPFIVTGAAFLVHTNVSSEWQATGFWTTICALVVQVLWLQSSTPKCPGFSRENGIHLIGLVGEDIILPYHCCFTFEEVHEFLNLIYSKMSGASDYVPRKCYELYQAGTSSLISADNWAACIQPGICMEMGLLDIGYFEDNVARCPYCSCEYDSPCSESSEVDCVGCSRRFRRTREDLDFARLASVNAVANISARRHSMDWDSAVSRMNVPVTALTTSAQYVAYVNVDAALSFARRCRRVHVVYEQCIYNYTPEQMQLASQQVVDTLISEQDTFSRSTLVYGLFRIHLQSLCRWNPKHTDYERNLRTSISMYNAALAEFEHSGALISNPRGNAVLYQPMTVVHQLLAQMFSSLNAFVEQPSEDSMCQWENVVKSYSGEYLSSDERDKFQELVREHGIISQDFTTAFGFAGRSS
ncbi:unnamed protein product [Peniophora sp. CBMAI 1063]|nr:unnamed protein product [Peniophora sp. CBMAI 1063]